MCGRKEERTINIVDAARLAADKRTRITRKAWEGHVSIMPTDTPDCCVAVSKIAKAPCPRWQPKAEDLMAEDWTITTEESI